MNLKKSCTAICQFERSRRALISEDICGQEAWGNTMRSKMNRGRGASSVYLLTVGWVDLPKSYSVNNYSPDEIIREPVPAVLVETVEGWVLLDTGYNKALIEDVALYNRFHGRFESVKPVLPQYHRDPLLDILERLNVRPSEISKIAISHLHSDHSGGIRNFSHATPIYLQKEEKEFAFGDQVRSESEGYARVDYDDPAINWRLVSGNCEIAPGIDAVSTPGHTPGHMSFVVHFDGDDKGGLVFACDAGDLRENFDLERAIGGYIDVDPLATIENIRLLKSIATRNGYSIIPGHDPDVWPKPEEGLVRKML